ncbi:ribokinase [Nakamurella lactea]|uniref:ribokinase n=1 Tax=Nakamurella lactea TaxID=459515 RepID=UPI00048B39A7|nr:ribokinase [Nakamurella lactea]
MTNSGRVVVVGSLNEDLRVRTPSVPAAGETVLGGPHDWGLGGKGSNQAIAAARFGADVAMIGRLGDDAGGGKIRAAFADEGIDGALLGTSDDAATGLALIILEPSGENRIIVSSGANLQVSPVDVTAGDDVVAAAAVLLAQLEIPLPAVQAAFDAASGITVLNAAPARALPAELLAATAVLVVNEVELAMIAGLSGAREVADADAIVAAVRTIDGPAAVIVTRGAAGALLVDGVDVTEFPAPKVDAIDTTGAGDCFCGVFAAALAEGMTRADAAAVAVKAASLAASRQGAAEGMPRRAEIDG